MERVSNLDPRAKMTLYPLHQPTHCKIKTVDPKAFSIATPRLLSETYSSCVIYRHPSEESVADPYLDPNVLSKLPEGERKKILRRQRNKEAAARCRKRRLDQTVSLEDQVNFISFGMIRRAKIKQKISR